MSRRQIQLTIDEYLLEEVRASLAEDTGQQMALSRLVEHLLRCWQYTGTYTNGTQDPATLVHLYRVILASTSLKASREDLGKAS